MSWEDRRPLSTAELLAIIEEDEDLQLADSMDAVYIPPPVDELTDEEDIDDQGCETEMNLPDVAGTYEIHVKLPEEETNEDVRSKSKKVKISAKTKIMPKWTKEHPIYKNSPQEEEQMRLEKLENKIAGKSPYEVFSLYFSEDVWEKIVDFSKKYANDHNRHSFELDKTSLKRFVGILIFSGYHTLPATKMFWSKDEDKGIPLVRNCMSRNRFDSIKQNIHLSDNDQLDKGDRFSKLRPIFDMINEKNMQFGIFSYNLSIDEEMVPYFGRHSCKMFMKGKPIRFGFKLWCLCSSDGYLYEFIPYGGRSSNNEVSDLGLGEKVVLNLLSVVQEPHKHRIFFDNFFSSHKLFCLLKDKGFYATGTIRENRTRIISLEAVKSIKKKDRGSYDFSFDAENEILLVRWNDNSVVTLATNNCKIEPLVAAKRYDRKEKKIISIPQPKLFAEYNKHKGGVDLHDNGISNYRIHVKGKKWWWPLFMNLIDSVVVNSWRIYNIANKQKKSQLEFKFHIALTLMKTEEAAENGQREEPSGPSNISLNYGRPSRNALPAAIRFDNIGHMIVEQENKTRRRCRQCKNNTIYMCAKCQVHLHSDCFKIFHTPI
nr:unnamed protein product [Callosobruchus chinensis]